MKKILILSGLLSLVAGITSCHDDLNNSPLDRYSEDKVWNSAASAQIFVNGTLYVKEQLVSKNGRHSDDWSDDMVINSQVPTAQNVVRDLLTSNNSITLAAFKWNMFPEIRRCNLIIEKATASENMTADEKAYLVAQGKMLRAIVYYDLARKFGRVVIVDRVLTPDDELKLARTATIKATYDFIIKDLQDAAVDLPVSAESGNLTRGAAYALLAEVALQGAAYLENAGDKPGYYAISKKASEDLFALGRYSLDSDYDGLFNNFSHGLASPEIILGSYWLSDNTWVSSTWQINYAPNQGSIGSKLPQEVADVWPMHDFLEGWFEKSPSQEIVDAYQVIDSDGAAKNWNETSYYDKFRQGWGSVHEMMYKHRDTRFYSTITYDSSVYMNSLLTLREGGNMYYSNNLEKDQHMSKSGYIYRKGSYLDRSKQVFANVPMDFHVAPLRLGRSYLNYAEVLLRTGDVPTAIEYVNRTRTTHGQLPPLPAGMTTDEAWEAYKNERRVELVLENDRYWSLLRWGKEAGLEVIPELNRAPKAIKISADGKRYEFIDVPVVGTVNNRSFSARRYLLPVPLNEITTNPALQQNPGWE